MQKTYCDDCGKQIPLGQRVLSGEIKLDHINKAVHMRVQFKSTIADDPDLCPGCSLAIVKMLREHVLSPKPELPCAECRCESFYGRTGRHAVGCPVAERAKNKSDPEAAEKPEVVEEPEAVKENGGPMVTRLLEPEKGKKPEHEAQPVEEKPKPEA